MMSIFKIGWSCIQKIAEVVGLFLAGVYWIIKILAAFAGAVVAIIAEVVRLTFRKLIAPVILFAARFVGAGVLAIGMMIIWGGIAFLASAVFPPLALFGIFMALASPYLAYKALTEKRHGFHGGPRC